MALFVQFVIAGVTLGSIYALVAFGFALIYRATSIMNIAQGDFSTVGAMVAVTLVGSLLLPLPVAVLVAIAVTVGLGVVVGRLVVPRVGRYPGIVLVMITIAISLSIQGLAGVLWGRDSMTLPAFSGSRPLPFLGAAVLPQTLWILGACVALTIIFLLFFERTILGIALRASAENPQAAALAGIRVGQMALLAFALGAAVGALAGILVTPIIFVNFQSGLLTTVKGSVAAILGGINSNVGVVVGGLILGLVESMSAGFFPTEYKDVIVLVALLVMLCAKPAGIIKGTAS